jgi:AraC-like DNA-binding protein
VRVSSEQYAVIPGDITCIQSGSVYSIASEAPGKHWCIHYYDTPVDGVDSIELPGHFRLGVNSLFYREQIQHIGRLFGSREISPNSERVKLEARFRLKALLLALHNYSTGHATGRRSRGNFSWDDLLAWVNENLDLPISVSLLAERANLAPNTLARKFKETYKTSVSGPSPERKPERTARLFGSSISPNLATWLPGQATARIE